MVVGAAAKAQMDGKLDLKEEQEIVMNIADMLGDLLNAESTLLRLQKLLARIFPKMVNFYISSNIRPIKLKLSEMMSYGLICYHRSKFYIANLYFSKYKSSKKMTIFHGL